MTTVLLDCDGVLANFVGRAIEAAHLPITHEEVSRWNFFDEFMTVQEFWECVDADPDFWTDLDPYPWARELVDAIRSLRFDIVITTSPSRNPSSASGKLFWLRKHGFLADHSVDYMIGHHKHLLAGSDTILIDDSDANVRRFRESGGRAILFPQRWNANRSQVDRRVQLVCHELIVEILHQEPALEQSVLLEAERIHRDRGVNYGHPRDHFARTVGQINALFRHKLKEPFEPHEWAMIMVADKQSRKIGNPCHRDNWVDGAGYENCGWMCVEVEAGVGAGP